MSYTEIPWTISASALEAQGNALMGDGFCEKRPAWASGTISDYDSRFLAGLVAFTDARNVVEIGVASGWSSAVLLQALGKLGGSRRVTGIDLSPTYYLDAAVETGQAVRDLVPDRIADYRLLTGRFAFAFMDQVGPVDFAFIDGQHMHPWATLDMISVLPFMKQGHWVAMHDLNLCTFERHKHTNRAPFYLFYMWPDRKLHSTQQPTMIGAVQIEREPQDYLPTLLEILCTPWEIDVDAGALAQLKEFIGHHFGSDWKGRFENTFASCRSRFNP